MRDADWLRCQHGVPGFRCQKKYMYLRVRRGRPNQIQQSSGRRAWKIQEDNRSYSIADGLRVGKSVQGIFPIRTYLGIRLSTRGAEGLMDPSRWCDVLA